MSDIGLTFASVRLISVLLIVSAVPVLAQQSVRTPEIPPYTEFAPTTEEKTFLRIGPLTGEGSLGLGYFYSDNANITGPGPGKLALSRVFEDLDLDLVAPLSPFNRIDLRLGGTLQENSYSNGTRALNLVIRPGSTIDLEAKLGEFLLTAFERFSIVQDPVADPTVTGTTNLNRLDNTLGVSLDRPLSATTDFRLIFAYSYSDTLGASTGTTFSSTQGGILRNSLSLGAQAAFELAPHLNAGLEVDGSYNSGDGRFDFFTFSLGPFLRGNLTRLLEVDAGIGPVLTAGPAGKPPLYYGVLSFRYAPTRLISILAGVDHDVEFSSGLGVSSNTKVRFALRADFSRKATFTIGPLINFGDVITGTFPGPYTQFGIEAELSYRLGKRLSLDLDYRFTRRTGPGSTNTVSSTFIVPSNYSVNEISFSLNYAF